MRSGTLDLLRWRPVSLTGLALALVLSLRDGLEIEALIVALCLTLDVGITVLIVARALRRQ